MRRTTILSLTAAAALATAPASALAHGPGHDMTPTPVATVASFTNGTLSLTLTDGSTLAAKVTDDTRLACEAAAPPPTTAGLRHHHHGHWPFGRHRHQRCSTDSLTAGTKVTKADVTATRSGAVFREVDLVK
jgi:hypothetical protein